MPMSWESHDIPLSQLPHWSLRRSGTWRRLPTIRSSRAEIKVCASKILTTAVRALKCCLIT